MTIYSIYKITNNINKKSYIGFTSRSVSARFVEHCRDNGQCGVTSAILKYGKQNFIVETLYQSHDRKHTVNVMEPYFIDLYKTWENGYNQTTGGEDLVGCANPMWGKSHSEQTRAKIKKKRALQDNTNMGKYERTDEMRKEASKVALESTVQRGVPKEVVTCPVCGKKGGKPAMTRFHFNNCNISRKA